MKRLIIIPAYNEAPVISTTIAKVKKVIKESKKSFDILVIDDGSNDNTYAKAKQMEALVARHKINRGLGGALGTGLLYAKKQNYDLAVTIDADGQHNPQDIDKVILPIETKKADLVIGSRTKSKLGQMPIDRRIINLLGNLVTWLLFGVWTSDSQSGFRSFSKKAISCIEIKTERMEVSSEIFCEVKKNNLKITEAPIQVIYTEYSRSKGQDNLNAFNVLYKLLLRIAR